MDAPQVCVGWTQAVRGGRGSGVRATPAIEDRADQYATGPNTNEASLSASRIGRAMFATQPICLMQSGVRPVQGAMGAPWPAPAIGITMLQGTSAIAVDDTSGIAIEGKSCGECASCPIGPPITANTTSTSRKRYVNRTTTVNVAFRVRPSSL